MFEINKYVAKAKLVTARLREYAQHMDQYQRVGDSPDCWINSATGHNVQVQFHIVPMPSVHWLAWVDQANGWTFFVPCDPCSKLSVEVVRKEYVIAAIDTLNEGEFFQVNGGWVLDSSRYFSSDKFDPVYPPTKLVHPDPLAWATPLTATLFSITTPNGGRVRLPAVVMEAPNNHKVSALYTIYENGVVRNGHTGSTTYSGNNREGVVSARLAVVDITVHNHNGTYLGIPNGVEVCFLDINEDYEGRSPTVHISLN